MDENDNDRPVTVPADLIMGVNTERPELIRVSARNARDMTGKDRKEGT
jgi:hypothetical protein